MTSRIPDMIESDIFCSMDACERCVRIRCVGNNENLLHNRVGSDDGEILVASECIRNFEGGVFLTIVDTEGIAETINVMIHTNIRVSRGGKVQTCANRGGWCRLWR